MLDFIVQPLRSIHDWWTLRRASAKKDRHLLDLRLEKPLLRTILGMVPLGEKGRRRCMHLVVMGRPRAIFGRKKGRILD